MMHCCQRYKRILYWDNTRLTASKIANYAQHISKRSGNTVGNVWAFVDETKLEICRPTHDEHLHYNEDAKAYVYKYQGVIAPDGMIIALIQSVNGCMHDSEAWVKAGIREKIQSIFRSQYEDKEYCPYLIYGDLGDYQGWEIMEPHGTSRGVLENSSEPLAAPQGFESGMSSLRVATNWGFRRVVNLWAFTSAKRQLRMYQKYNEYIFPMAVLLTNLQCCFYGNQIGKYYECKPPTAEEYLGIRVEHSAAEEDP